MPVGAVPFPFGACRICNDRATGVHYGVATCEGCKGFFKRSITRGDRYKCFFGDQCSISPQTRNRCKACRYRRCQEQGMALDAVKMGRIPKVEKEKALMLARRGSAGPSSANADASIDSSEDCMSPEPKQFDSHEVSPSSLCAQPGAGARQALYPFQQPMDVANGHSQQLPTSSPEGFASNPPYTLGMPMPSSASENSAARSESLLDSSEQGHSKWPPSHPEQSVFRDLDSHQLQAAPSSFSTSVDAVAPGVPTALCSSFTKTTSQHPQALSWQPGWPPPPPPPLPSPPLGRQQHQQDTVFMAAAPGSHQLPSSCPDMKPFHSLDRPKLFRPGQQCSGGEGARAGVVGSTEPHGPFEISAPSSRGSSIFTHSGPSSSSHPPSQGQPHLPPSHKGSSNLQGSVYSSSVLKVLYDQVVRQSGEDHLLEKLASKCTPSTLSSSIKLLSSLAPESSGSSASSPSEQSLQTTVHTPSPSIPFNSCAHPAAAATSTSAAAGASSLPPPTPMKSSHASAPISPHSFPQQVPRWESRGAPSDCVEPSRHPNSVDVDEDSKETAIKDFSRRMTEMAHQGNQHRTTSSDVRLFNACFGIARGTQQSRNCVEEHAEFLKQKPKLPVLDDATLEEFLGPDQTPGDSSVTYLSSDSSTEEMRSDLPCQWPPPSSTTGKMPESNFPSSSCVGEKIHSTSKQNGDCYGRIKTEPGLDQNGFACQEAVAADHSSVFNGNEVAGGIGEQEPAEPVVPSSPRARVFITKSLQKHFAALLTWKRALQEFLEENPTDPFQKEEVSVLTSEDMKELWGRLTTSLRDWTTQIIGYCKEVPGFLSLDAGDQSLLLKRAYYDIWMIMASPYLLHNKSYLRFPDGELYKKWVMEKIVSKAMVDHLFKFAEQFNALRLNDTAVAILCAIQLTAASHDSEDYANMEAIQQLNSVYLDHLVDEVSALHPHTCSRILVDIFRLIPLLMDINKLQSQLAAHYVLTDPRDSKVDSQTEEEEATQDAS